jgi:hypothetical protein
MCDSQQIFKNEDDAVKYLGIQQYNYVDYNKMRMRKFKENMFSKGECLLRYMGRKWVRNTDGRRNVDLYKPIHKIGNKDFNHYIIKNYFYNTADFSITYMPDENTYIKYSFKVKFKKNIQGSLSFSDMDIKNEKDTITFFETLDKDEEESITNYNGSPDELAKRIGKKMIHVFKDKLKKALIRELKEECSPSGGNELILNPDDFVNIMYTTEKSNEGGKLSYKIYFVINFPDSKSENAKQMGIEKQREMDSIDILYNGKPMHMLYIYGGKYNITPYYTTSFPYKKGNEQIIMRNISAKCQGSQCQHNVNVNSNWITMGGRRKTLRKKKRGTKKKFKC